MQAKPGMRKCSPEFFMNADDQHGQQVGPVAAGGAWTNYPFLEGCELNEFEKKGSPAMPKKSKFARMMEAAGIDEKDDDAVKMSKLRAYSAGEEAAEGRNAESEDDDPKKPAQMEGAAAAPADGKGKTEMEDPQAGPAGTQQPDHHRHCRPRGDLDQTGWPDHDRLGRRPGRTDQNRHPRLKPFLCSLNRISPTERRGFAALLGSSD
jgi:hypothetical protein